MELEHHNNNYKRARLQTLCQYLEYNTMENGSNAEAWTVNEKTRIMKKQNV